MINFILFFATMAMVVLACLGICWVLVRNNEVYKYRMGLIDRSFAVCGTYLKSIEWKTYTLAKQEKFEELSKTAQSIMNVSYEAMVFSLKPLRDEFWLTKEQIEFLNLQF